MTTSQSIFSKIVFTVLLFMSIATQLTANPRVDHIDQFIDQALLPRKISEIIKDNDPRYLATLTAGVGLAFTGLALTLKNYWSKKSIDDFERESSLEDLERWQTWQLWNGDYNRGNLASWYFWSGLFVIANAKNIPAFYDMFGEWIGMSIQEFLSEGTLKDIFGKNRNRSLRNSPR